MEVRYNDILSLTDHLHTGPEGIIHGSTLVFQIALENSSNGESENRLPIADWVLTERSSRKISRQFRWLISPRFKFSRTSAQSMPPKTLEGKRDR